MLRLLFIEIIILCGVFSNCFAGKILGQEHSESIDSLSQVLKTAKEDTTKIALLNSLSIKQWQSGDFTNAMKNASDALALSQKVKYTNGIVAANNNIGMIYFQQGDYVMALKNYSTALILAKEAGDKRVLAVTYNNIGTAYDIQGNYLDALKNYFTSLEIAEEIEYKKIIASVEMNIGIVYQERENYPAALENYLVALKIAEEENDKQTIAYVYNNIGDVNRKQGKYSESLENHFTSLKIKEEIGDTVGIIHTYISLGEVYNLQGKLTEAKKYFQKSLMLAGRINDKSDIAAAYLSLGKLNTKTKNTAEASVQIQKGLTVAKEIGSKEQIKESYRLLSDLASSIGNFESSYKYHLLYDEMKDSISNESSNKQIAQLKIQYETEKKDKDIQLLNKNNEIITIRNKEQKFIIRVLIGSFVFFLLSILIYYRLYNQRRKAKFRHQILETEMKALRSQMNPHFTFNVLNSIQYFVGGNDMKAVEFYLNKFSSLIRMILEQSRNTYITLEEEINMLRVYLELEEMLFEKKFTYQIDIDENIIPEKTLIHGMLIQPIVENAIKHGLEHKKGEAKVTVSFTSHNSTLVCTVNDNGIGRAAAEKRKSVASHKSVATDIIKERMNALSSIYNIKLSYRTEDLFDEDGKPAGTSVTMEMPIGVKDEIE